jgi:hypothetical protein
METTTNNSHDAMQKSLLVHESDEAESAERGIPEKWAEGIRNLQRLKILLPWLQDEEEGLA